jgi:hypothetical protein
VESVTCMDRLIAPHLDSVLLSWTPPKSAWTLTHSPAPICHDGH